MRLAVKAFTTHTGFDEGESQPDQDPNVEPLSGVAVSVTCVPLGKLLVKQADAQLRPGGALVTVPKPPPKKFTVRVGPAPPPPEPVKQTTFAVI